MTQLIALLRGLVHRAGSTVMILVVASVAAAAAAAGPVYYESVRASILRDGLISAQSLGRGYEATLAGPVAQILPELNTDVGGELRKQLGAAEIARMFQPPVASLEGDGTDLALNDPFSLVWRTAYCAHLVVRGSCPKAANQVIISRSDVPITGWHIGSRITRTGWPTLTVTGVYQPPRLTASYWLLRAAQYFPLLGIPRGLAASGGAGCRRGTARRRTCGASDRRSRTPGSRHRQGPVASAARHDARPGVRSAA